MLPIIPEVYAALKARHDEAGNPEEGWGFPANSREGHLNKEHRQGPTRAGDSTCKRECQEDEGFASEAVRALCP